MFKATRYNYIKHLTSLEAHQLGQLLFSIASLKANLLASLKANTSLASLEAI